MNDDVGGSSGLRVAVHFPNYGVFAGTVEKMHRALPEWKKQSKKTRKRRRLLGNSGLDGNESSGYCVGSTSDNSANHGTQDDWTFDGGDSRKSSTANGSNIDNKLNAKKESVSSESGSGCGAEWIVCFDDGDRKAFSSQEAFAYAVKTYAQVSWGPRIDNEETLHIFNFERR